jgi:PilZ domain
VWIVERQVTVISKERRSSRRFMLRLPLTVQWTDKGGVNNVATESQDVSSRGLYFYLPNELKAGSPVRIVMAIRFALTEQVSVRVRYHGRVLRNSPEHSGNVGVAASIERYEFLPNDVFEVHRREFFGL